jgi:hypothetical protein
MMSHWVEQIRQYGALQQYSAEKHEVAHKTNLKDGWNACNNNLNYLPQVITCQRRILFFDVRELNPQALAQCGITALPHAQSSIPVLIWLPP